MLNHGHARKSNVSSEYKTWRAMIRRCGDLRHPYYLNYGGRGITVHVPWKESFTNFLQDMGAKPEPKKLYSIDRLDSAKGYYPENCIWATRLEQGRNTRRNHILECNGAKFCISEWEGLTGISQKTILNRLRKGWSIEKALTTTIDARKRNRNAKEPVCPNS